MRTGICDAVFKAATISGPRGHAVLFGPVLSGEAEAFYPRDVGRASRMDIEFQADDACGHSCSSCPTLVLLWPGDLSFQLFFSPPTIPTVYMYLRPRADCASSVVFLREI